MNHHFARDVISVNSLSNKYRFVVPALTPSQQQELAAGRVSLDDLTRRFVRDHLTYRFVVTADGAEAARLEVEA
jgi:hypothetical protein